VLNFRRMIVRGLTRAILVAGLAGLACAATLAPASAQNLFDFFFNGARRPSPPPTATAYADPESLGAKPSDPEPRVDMGPSVSFCVRLCDGRYFPIQRTAATPVEVCNSFCPAAKTKIFSGGSIDHAVAHDGSRYADLTNAFVYRTKVVPGCSCNGRDAFGLVNMKATEDPTLRQGDVVATPDGFVAYSGTHRKTADFTPINSSSASAETRRQLAQTRIAPGAPPTEPAAVADSAASARDGTDDWPVRQVQLDR